MTRKSNAEYLTKRLRETEDLHLYIHWTDSTTWDFWHQMNQRLVTVDQKHKGWYDPKQISLSSLRSKLTDELRKPEPDMIEVATLSMFIYYRQDANT